MTDSIFALIQKEEKRLKEVIPLIASENITSEAVRKAVGSVLMCKYAEGYPQKRYYQGNNIIDRIEDKCRKRALKAFGLKPNKWGVNVQPHSGCEANLAVYNGLLKPGAKILAMYLPDGGHLSHGWQIPGKKVTLVSKIFNIFYYKVDPKTKVFDYGEIARIADHVGPDLIISGGTAYPREIDYQQLSSIAKKVNAYYMADVSHEAGLIAAKVNKSPYTHADVVTMTTHKTLRGPRGAMIIARKNYRTDTGDKQDLAALIDTSIFPGVQGGPHIHTIAGIAVALKEAQTNDFTKYSKQIVANAKLFAQLFAKAGFEVVSSGTDKHLVLLDLRTQKIQAWIAAWALEHVNIILNRNTVPYETASPYYPSGLRLGTPAMTTRGMKQKEVRQIAKWMITVMRQVKKYTIPKDKQERTKLLKFIRYDLKKDKKLLKIKQEVKTLASSFPLFHTK